MLAEMKRDSLFQMTEANMCKSKGEMGSTIKSSKQLFDSRNLEVAHVLLEQGTSVMISADNTSVAQLKKEYENELDKLLIGTENMYSRTQVGSVLLD